MCHFGEAGSQILARPCVPAVLSLTLVRPLFHTFPPSLESAVAMWCKKIYIAAVLAGSASAFVSSRPTSDQVP